MIIQQFQHNSTPALDGTDVFSSEFLPRPVVGFPCTELANADRMMHYYGDSIRYCYAWKKWLTWTGTHWREDNNGEVNRMAEYVTRAILIESAIAEGDDVTKKAKWYFETAAARKIRAFLELTQPKVAITPEQLDRYPYLLNVQNGTLDLNTGELLPHDPEHLITRCLPIEFDQEAECPRWKEFLLSIMGGNENLVSYLQRAVGYALTGDVREQVLFILHGKGANGKSTFVDTISQLLGPYSQQMPTESLMQRRDKGIPNDIARLRGARFVAAVETEEGRSLSEVLVKQLTGGDTITARFLNQEFFEFVPSHKIFLATNHLPKVKGTDHAIWRRLPLIPFKVTFWNPEKDESGPPELRMDKTLSSKLQEELPGILTWAMTGLLHWKNEGLGWPPEVRAATNAYQSDQDTLAGFIEEQCTLAPSASVFYAELYDAYLKWADDTGEKPVGKKMFGQRLDERNITSAKGAGNKAVRVGISLAPVMFADS